MTQHAQGRLAAQLGGQLHLEPEWRELLLTVPRHLFVPERAWHHRDSKTLVEIDRQADPQGWMAAVYSNDVIVTQQDAQGQATSSTSQPSLVFGMLRHLDVREGQTVLEIGTGTGWNAGLLAKRVGSSHVVTVEVDADVVAQARQALVKAGLSPKVVTGDGAQGFPDNAPYDRVIATCSANVIPWAWVEQTKPGGVIVAPWDTPLGLGGLLRLEVDADRVKAEGRFVNPASFMMLRQQILQVPDEPDTFDTEAEQSTVRVDLGVVRSNLARFAVGLSVHGCKSFGYTDGDEIWLCATDSWAHVDPKTGTVKQLGMRRLWHEVEAAFNQWIGQGSPHPEEYGMTRTRDEQVVWLREPPQVVSRRVLT